MNDIAKLKIKLEKLGAGRIWRQVTTPEGEILNEGVGHNEDGLPPDFSHIDLKGKSIVDIGCNLGFFCMQAKDMGATDVLGIDLDPEVVEAAQLFCSIQGYPTIRFQALDITTDSPDETFDIGFMIDILGKENIKMGLAPALLDGISDLCSEAMVHTFRPYYKIKQAFGMSAQELAELYPANCIEKKIFRLDEYVRQRMAHKWDMKLLTQKGTQEIHSKHLYLFTRK